ncbi:MAG: hypothetical protein PVG45_09415 [Gammaproteobacteria bacterium]|jgi:hypothetical protein
MSLPGFAGSVSDYNNSTLDVSIEKLDKLNYLPSLLPVIINNRDFIGLTDDQYAQLDDWRKTNKEPMLAAMKEIALRRVEIQEAALSPTISSARLMQMQNDIFRLQREVLKYKLSCRDRVMSTFTSENWISFYMVLADENMAISVPFNYAEK